MRLLNIPAEAGDRSEMLRRLAGVRATVPHLRGTRVRHAPLSETRIKRITAPLITALNQCKSLTVNPAKGTTGKAKKTRPLLWTGPRAERWRRTGERPSPVMVWTAEQTGAFLDSIAGDRLYPAYHVASYWGCAAGRSPGWNGPTSTWPPGSSTSARRRPTRATGSSRSTRAPPPC
ncbi:MAG: hypothetical protein ACRDOK_25150 [Streptosporangiaceae bacterium]